MPCIGLEGERFASLRLLRATKNRFGSTEEVGVLEMGELGLSALGDPARAFLDRARRERLGQRRRADPRRLAAAHGRGPGPDRLDRLRHAPPDRQRDRPEPAGPARRRPRPAGRHRPGQPRRLRQPGRRPGPRRAGPRPAGRACPGQLVPGSSGSPGHRRDRRGRPARRAALGCAAWSGACARPLGSASIGRSCPGRAGPARSRRSTAWRSLPWPPCARLSSAPSPDDSSRTIAGRRC